MLNPQDPKEKSNSEETAWQQAALPSTHKPHSIKSLGRISREDILAVTKLSKVEFDMQRLKVDEAKLRELYEGGGENPERIFSSHRRQLLAKAALSEELPAENIIARDEITSRRAKEAKLVIAFGGDNHFQHVSHFLDGTPLLGINSDPESSHGGLLSRNAAAVHKIFKELEMGKCLLEPWTRLALKVNGKSLPLASADIFLGEDRRVLMSRHTLQVFRPDSSGKLKPISPEVEQKCSGLLVSTGAGSTGWFRTIARQFSDQDQIFERTEQSARFAASEVSFTQKHRYPEMLFGELQAGDVLRVVSLNRQRGVASVDSLISATFPRGSVAEISISEKALYVVRGQC